MVTVRFSLLPVFCLFICVLFWRKRSGLINQLFQLFLFAEEQLGDNLLLGFASMGYYLELIVEYLLGVGLPMQNYIQFF